MNTSARVAQMLAQTLTAHGIDCTVSDDDIVSLTDIATGFRGTVERMPRTDTVLLRLTINAVGPVLGGRAIQERFAGLGDDANAALNDAFAKFLLGPFHVLLTVLGDHACEQDGTEWTIWRNAHQAWRVCDSALVVQGGDPLSVPFAPVLEDLRAAFLASAMPGVHWISTFFAFVNGTPSCEVRLDGAQWPDGEAVVRAWHFTPSENYLTGRHFLMAIPEDTPS